ncbi:MAG: hypothetical protein ACTHJ4_04015 [Candidatus Nucleicultricaceae bacterium]
MERNQRLRISGSIPTQDMLSWAARFRVHQEDPQWYQHVIKENCWERLDFKRWENRNHWEDLTVLKIIDTTYLTLPQVAYHLEKWINSIKVTN